jgi:hypothetical protein
MDDRTDELGGANGLWPSAIRAARAVLLAGLSSAEILAVAMVAVGAVAASWATGALRPEDLVTQSWLRALWAALLIAIVRPLTWFPYLGAFAGTSRLASAINPDGSARFRTLAGHVGAIASIGTIVVLVLIAVDGAGRSVASAAGFLTGAIPLQDLGSSLGSWSIGRILALVLALVLIRPVVPPLRPDLSVEFGPILEFHEGRRGEVDRFVLWGAAGLAVVLGGVALVAAG